MIIISNQLSFLRFSVISNNLSHDNVIYVKIQIEKNNSPCAVRSNIKRPTNRSDSMSSLFRKHCQQTTQLAL